MAHAFPKMPTLIYRPVEGIIGRNVLEYINILSNVWSVTLIEQDNMVGLDFDVLEDHTVP